MNSKILIVEDDDNLRNSLADNLEIDGFEVESFAYVAEARAFLLNNIVDLIILDIMLPDGDGFELCRWIRARSEVLVLMLTARNLEKDVVEGFIAGADDYLSKPYRSVELVLRIKALLRRNRSTKQQQNTQLNSHEINWRLQKVTQDDKPIHLTKTAFGILEYLYSQINQPCSRDQILDAVWGENVYVDNRTIDNFVSSLKKQLNLVSGAEYQITTIRGIGYSLIHKN